MKPGDTIEYSTAKGGRSRLVQAEIVEIVGVGDECYLDLLYGTGRRPTSLRLSQITSIRVTTPIGRRK